METNWRKSPGGREISTARGERMRDWFRSKRRDRLNREFAFGFSVRAVTFADHRSGWSALLVNVDLGWWCFTFYPVRWKNGPSDADKYRIVTLAEQVAKEHGVKLRTETMAERFKRLDEEEAKGREEQRTKLAEFQAELDAWEQRRKDKE